LAKHKSGGTVESEVYVIQSVNSKMAMSKGSLPARVVLARSYHASAASLGRKFFVGGNWKVFDVA
jgi:hypothetical protein